MCRTHVFRSIGEQVGSLLMPWARRRSAREQRSASAEARLAACALLLEIAWADGVFTPDERALVESTIRDQFGLGGCEARQLVDEAAEARRRGMPVWHFTRAAHTYTDRQRRLLVRFLHALANLDGDANTQEALAVDRISSLMRVETTVRGAAA